VGGRRGCRAPGEQVRDGADRQGVSLHALAEDVALTGPDVAPCALCRPDTELGILE
jgi:hypothetical protein